MTTDEAIRVLNKNSHLGSQVWGKYEGSDNLIVDNLNPQIPRYRTKGEAVAIAREFNRLEAQRPKGSPAERITANQL